MQVIKKYAKTNDQVSEILDRMIKLENTLYDGYELVKRYGKQYLRLLFIVKDPAKAWWMACVKYTPVWYNQKMMTKVIILEEATAEVLESAAWKRILSKHGAGLQTPQKMHRDFPENFEEVMEAITKIAKPIIKMLIERKAEALKARAKAVGLKEDASEEQVLVKELEKATKK